MEAAYLRLARGGGLSSRAEAALEKLKSCRLCPHRCRVDRLSGVLGFCRVGRWAVVAGAGPHYGEEPPLVGTGGSGTIFFSGCNLACLYCQNYDISRLGRGLEVRADELAELMLSLQRQGCENVNLVSPSHVVPQILEALTLAAKRGLRLPLVYNSGGYDSVQTLRLLDGVVDIYMPDAKYADENVARELSEVSDYFKHNRAAIREMHRQVGDLRLDARGVATRGLLVRHLVLPEDLAGSKRVFHFLASEISPETYVNVMGQYHPCFRAGTRPELARRPTRKEIEAAVEAARAAGLTRLD